MRYFLDTEFIEDGRTIDLISIGIVAEDGRELYAVSTEAQLHLANDWVRANVLPHLPKYGNPHWMSRADIKRGLTRFVSVSSEETDFGEPFAAHNGIRRMDPKPEFWGYYADYDWVVLCRLFGRMIDLPKHFPMFCRDLKQLSVDLGNPEHPPDPADAHNALADARWNRDLYRLLTQLRDQQAAERGA
jgi:3' exoribonuclease, RNase T-like